MWWDKKARPIRSRSPNPAGAPPAKLKWDESMTQTKSRELSSTPSSNDQTVLGESVLFRGELAGGEDMLLEGQFEGNVNLQDHCLTIGPKGQVKAEIRARQVIVYGSVEGNISADEKIEIRKTGHVVGDLLTAGIAIEEGGYFKGSIDLLREGEIPRVVAAPRPPEVQPKRREGLGAIGVGESPGIDQ